MLPLGRGHEAKSLTSNGMLPHHKTKKRGMVATRDLKQWRKISTTSALGAAPDTKWLQCGGLSTAVGPKLLPS